MDVSLVFEMAGLDGLEAFLMRCLFPTADADGLPLVVALPPLWLYEQGTSNLRFLPIELFVYKSASTSWNPVESNSGSARMSIITSSRSLFDPASSFWSMTEILEALSGGPK